MIEWTERIDPRRNRTVFVYTKFYSNVLRTMATSKDLNKYLSSACQCLSMKGYARYSAHSLRTGSPVSGAFFVSVFSAGLRKKLIADRVSSTNKPKEGIY